MTQTFFHVTGEPPAVERVDLEPESEGRYWIPRRFGPAFPLPPRAQGYAPTAPEAVALALAVARTAEADARGTLAAAARRRCALEDLAATLRSNDDE